MRERNGFPWIWWLTLRLLIAVAFGIHVGGLPPMLTLLLQLTHQQSIVLICPLWAKPTRLFQSKPALHGSLQGNHVYLFKRSRVSCSLHFLRDPILLTILWVLEHSLGGLSLFLPVKEAHCPYVSAKLSVSWWADFGKIQLIMDLRRNELPWLRIRSRI